MLQTRQECLLPVHLSAMIEHSLCCQQEHGLQMCRSPWIPVVSSGWGRGPGASLGTSLLVERPLSPAQHPGSSLFMWEKDGESSRLLVGSTCHLWHGLTFVGKDLFIWLQKGFTLTHFFNNTKQFWYLPRLSHSLNPHFSNCLPEIRNFSTC